MSPAAGLAAGSALADRTDLLPVLLVVSLVAFVGTVVVERICSPRPMPCR